MKKLLCIAVLLTAGFVAGCGKSACDELADICAKCTDQTTKDSCNQTVATYKAVPISGNTGCQAVIDAKTYANCGSP